MNGVIRYLGKGVLLLFAVGFPVGCASLNSCVNCNSCGEPACDTCQTESCGKKCGGCASDCDTCGKRGLLESALGCGGCGEKGCGGCKSGCGGCKEPCFSKGLRNFDWEQVYPDHCWPDQYARESIRRINAPFGQQIANGSSLEQTVWEHYFQDENGYPSNELNEAGMSRLRYLARRKPFAQPTLEMQTSFNEVTDAKRRDAVLAYAKTVSFEPIDWQVVLVDRTSRRGLFGAEGPKAITKMIGPGAGPPAYEAQIKQGFLTGNSGQ